MAEATQVIHDGKPIELVFGLVGPTGVDLTTSCSALQEQLKAVGYDSHIVRLSELICPFLGKDLAPGNEYERINGLMTAGTTLRQGTEQADIVGRLGVVRIREIRQGLTGNQDLPPTAGVAYIVRSFKRPEEVRLFRDIYGKAFNLISVYSPRASRIQHLTKKLGGIEPKEGVGPEELAVRLITRDYEEEEKLGQRLGRTFPLADFFVTNAARSQIGVHLRRLVRLIFADPYISPSKDEQGMFFAQAAALRSLDLSRQVGAAVVSEEGDVLATGCNEVPKSGGGLYWDSDPEVARDFEQGRDSNVQIKTELLVDAVRRLKEKGWLSHSLRRTSDEELAKGALYGVDPFFRDSRLFDVIEFGRAVHAEMAAITQAARLGIALKDARMFCTTFPCHICARHIVSAGLKELVFIEPYEKSRTNELFADSISVEPHEPSPKRVNFRSFVGVAPRRYMDFFSLTGERKSEDGQVLEAGALASRPRVSRLAFTYLAVEQKFVEQIRRPHGEQLIVQETSDDSEHENK